MKEALILSLGVGSLGMLSFCVFFLFRLLKAKELFVGNEKSLNTLISIVTLYSLGEFLSFVSCAVLWFLVAS